MKILVCTDGSEHSQKALEEASIIAGGCNADKVTIIHVYKDKSDYSTLYTVNDKELNYEMFRSLAEKHKEAAAKILSDAMKIFEKKNIKADTMLKEGHPAKTILKVASEEEFDMIVIGSRGVGGWKKRILGSVSSAVVQEAKNCTVVTVK
jgi:nucleotide-binding universal stress UspA family protein